LVGPARELEGLVFPARQVHDAMVCDFLTAALTFGPLGLTAMNGQLLYCVEENTLGEISFPGFFDCRDDLAASERQGSGLVL